MIFLKTIKKPPQTIFTTAYREFALESYDLEIVDYLLKPITFDRFFKAVERYLRQYHKPVNVVSTAPEIPFITLKSGIKNYKINVADIIYIESIRDYIKILTTESELTIKYKISHIEIELRSQRFLRVHRSFIVNTEKITSFSPSIVELGKKEIPIGPMYKQSVDAALR